MILPHRLVLLGLLLAVRPLAAQAPSGAEAAPDPTAAPQISPAAERNTRLLERYKAMLAANPVEGLALDRLWKSAQEQGTTPALLDEYRRAAEAQPPQVATILVYGHLLQRAGRLDDARAAFLRAASADPANLLAPLALGDLATSRAQRADAAAFYEAAAAKLPPDDRRRPDILLKLGNAWIAAKEPLKAAAAWEKIVAANPGDLALQRRLADNYEKNSLPEQAIAHYETIEQHADPEQRAGALRELARLHEGRGEIDAASAALERGLTLTARGNWLHGELERSLIRLYQRAGRVPELAARWRAEVEKNPRDLGGYLRLERLAAAQGDAAAQRAWLEQIVALAPNDREDTLQLARLLTNAGERERAAALYDTLLKDQPAALDLVFARAELDLQLGHLPAAVDRIEACVARSPADESVTTPALQFFLSHHLDQAAEHRLQADVVRQPKAEEPALALAKFYLSQRREAEARSVLENLIRQPGDAAAKMGRLLRVADSYKDGRLFDDALRCWREAGDLDPTATAPLLAAADALALRGNTAAASAAYEQALKIARAGPGEVEIEHKLLVLLQTADATANASGPHSPAALPAGNAADPARGRRLEQYIARLQAAARQNPTAAAYLRLARWQSWSRAANDAAISAEKAITLEPGNISARELLVGIAIELHQRDAAEQRLREIMALDPAQSAACRRRIAQLKVEDGDFDAAIALFHSLQEEEPGSVTALTDLALAQQRADRWYDALTTWERASALPGATPAERTDVRRPLLLALERLGQFPRGAEVLQNAIDAQTDLTARQDLFQELVGYCQRHDLTGWLQQQYAARLTAQPTDYFTLTALATLQKAAGHAREAYNLLRQANFSAADPVRSLPALVNAAEALGETAEAVSWQSRLLVVPGQDTADNLERLANLENGGFAIDEAARTWEQAVVRFPRQSDVLDKAADFFEKTGRAARARELLGQAVALDPVGLKRLFRLGQLDLAAGDNQGTLRCFEQILDRSEPEKAGLPLLPPPDLLSKAGNTDPGFTAAVARFRTRFSVAASAGESSSPEAPADERELRLAAIRGISELYFPPLRREGARPAAFGTDQDRQQWLERWKTAVAGGARSEPFCAFYYCRDAAQAMDALDRWMKSAPADETLRNLFASTGLHLAAYRSLAHWAWDEPNTKDAGSNGRLLVDALIGYLQAGGKPGPDMVAELFPPGVTLRELLWKAAEEGFAAQDRYAEAAELGERAAALSSSSRANYVLPVVQWELYLGRVDRARAVLRAAIGKGGGGDSFEPGTNPVFVALREYFLLLPENERAGFSDEYLRTAAAAEGPVHAVLAAVLLHGLAGGWKTAEGDLDRLLALRMLASDSGGGSPDARRWTYVLNNGLQLQEGGLEPLAVHLWQRALQEANAFELQDNDTAIVRSDIRSRLLDLQVALAPDPSRARQYVADYLREDPPAGNVAQLATQFRESSGSPAAVLLHEYLCRVEPTDPEYWRNLFAAYAAAGNYAAYDQVLTTFLHGTQPLPNGLSRAELIGRQASVREDEGDGESARRLLERARQTTLSRSVPLLAQLANSYLLAGQTDKAVETWRQALPFDLEGHAALALANLEDGNKHRQAAIEVLEQARQHLPGDFEITVQLARLYAATGRIDDVRAIANGRLQAGDLNALIGMAAGIDDPAACLALRAVLADAARRAHEPAERFRAQLGVVDLYRTRANDDPAFELELQRLERFAGTTPGLRSQFMQERFDVARKRGADAWLHGELTREWAAGEGDVAAGALLVRLCLETNQAEPLRKVVAEIDARANLPELMLFNIGQELGTSKYAALALPIAERLTRRFPEKEAYALARARVCWTVDRRDEARRLLETLDVTSITVENVADHIGDLYNALGDRAGAREFYGRAVARDPWALRSSSAYLHLAQADIEEKNYDAARRLLLVAYRHPECTDLSPLLAYLTATGRADPDAVDRLPGAEFPLTSANRAHLLTALCEKWEKTSPAEARRLALAHPELWGEASAVVEYLCLSAHADDWSALATALEDAWQQSSPPDRALAHALAGLYVRFGSAESQKNETAAAALAHLARAHELEPDDFAIARQLAELYVARKQPTRAAEALRDFLAPDAFPAERQQAQQILARK